MPGSWRNGAILLWVCVYAFPIVCALVLTTAVADRVARDPPIRGQGVVFQNSFCAVERDGTLVFCGRPNPTDRIVGVYSVQCVIVPLGRLAACGRRLELAVTPSVVHDERWLVDHGVSTPDELSEMVAKAFVGEHSPTFSELLPLGTIRWDEGALSEETWYLRVLYGVAGVVVSLICSTMVEAGVAMTRYIQRSSV